MAFDCNNPRKPLLFSDLFKSHRNMALEKEQQDIVVSSCSSSSTLFSSSRGDSSSSGFSTPLRSDLGTSESEDGDFIAELTRQMAECMLQEDEEENTVANCEASCPAKIAADEGCPHSVDVNCLKTGFDDQMSPKVRVYELKNQPPVRKEGRFCQGKRVIGIESAQQKQSQKTDQKHTKRRLQREKRDGYSASGMQAVFLGGAGSRSGSSGTGVFLPRNGTELKNKSGCPMVLIPTRVLQVLELHFSKYQDSTAPVSSRRTASPLEESMISNGPQYGPPELETRPADGDKMQLPQEWTY